MVIKLLFHVLIVNWINLEVKSFVIVPYVVRYAKVKFPAVKCLLHVFNSIFV